MPIRFHADRFILRIPDAWLNETVYRFSTPDNEEKITLTVEVQDHDAPLEAHLAQRTETLRESPQATLRQTGDVAVGGYPAKFYIAEILRGDEVLLVYVCVLAKLSPRELLVIDFETPASRWQRSQGMFESVWSSLEIAG